MTTAVIFPSLVSGEWSAPPSKSIAQRALVLALLHPGKTIIRQPGHCEDVEAAKNAAHQCGAQISLLPSGDLEILSTGKPDPESVIHCGESALGARLFTAIAAISGKEVTITGRDSLLKRPMDGFAHIFSELGVQFKSTQGKLPITVKGPYQVRPVEIDGHAGSQYASALLIALAGMASSETTIIIRSLASRPYLDITIQMLRDFGYSVRQDGYDSISVAPAVRSHNAMVDISVEGDWSSAAFILVAAAVAGDIQLSGLHMDSLQGDRRILEVLAGSGASVMVKDGVIKVNKSMGLSAFRYDATDTPDLFPPLAVLASHASGTSEIKGIHRLHGKESDRAKSITAMLDALGVSSFIADDTLFVKGGDVRGGNVDSAGDHRIAMAAAVAGLGAREKVTVKNTDPVNKSYPSFFDALKSLGASVTLTGEKQIS